MTVRTCDNCGRPPDGDVCPDSYWMRIRWDDDGNVICRNYKVLGATCSHDASPLDGGLKTEGEVMSEMTQAEAKPLFKCACGGETQKVNVLEPGQPALVVCSRCSQVWTPEARDGLAKLRACTLKGAGVGELIDALDLVVIDALKTQLAELRERIAVFEAVNIKLRQKGQTLQNAYTAEREKAEELVSHVEDLALCIEKGETENEGGDDERHAK